MPTGYTCAIRGSVGEIRRTWGTLGNGPGTPGVYDEGHCSAHI